MSKTTKITRRKKRPQQPGAICTLILHKNFLLESHLEVFAADREEDSSDESSKDEGSQYNYEFKTFCTFTVFVVLKSTFVRLVTRVRSKLQPNLTHSAHSMDSELVIFILEDSQGTSWFESATERKPCQYVRARICVA